MRSSIYVVLFSLLMLVASAFAQEDADEALPTGEESALEQEEAGDDESSGEEAMASDEESQSSEEEAAAEFSRSRIMRCRVIRIATTCFSSSGR